ncbi:MAG: hypothetical protein QW727_03005 [Candidatus Pacearchaeota archaeon]
MRRESKLKFPLQPGDVHLDENLPEIFYNLVSGKWDSFLQKR